MEAFVLIELTCSWLCWVAMRGKDRRIADVRVNSGGQNGMFLSAIEYARCFLLSRCPTEDDHSRSDCRRFVRWLG